MDSSATDATHTAAADPFAAPSAASTALPAPPPLPAPPALFAEQAERRDHPRPFQLTNGWTNIFWFAWAGVAGSWAAIWASSRTTGLATWCVRRTLREDLQQCGFASERLPGVPPKQHRLVARFAPACRGLA